MPIAFTTTVSKTDWDQRLGGWRCSVLKIPSIDIDAVYIDGVKQDTRLLEVLPEHNIIRWKGSEHPTEAVLSFKITKDLSTNELTLKWKKMAIMLPVLAILITGILGPIITYVITSNLQAERKSEVNSVINEAIIKNGIEQRVQFGETMLDYFDKHEYDTAENMADEVIERYKGHPYSLVKAYYVKGAIASKKNEIQRSIKHLRKALDNAKRISDGNFVFVKQKCAGNLARVYIKNNSPKMAIDILKSVSNPIIDNDWLYIRGLAYLYDSKYEEAIKFFEAIPTKWTWSGYRSRRIAKIQESAAYVAIYESNKEDEFLTKARNKFRDGFKQNPDFWKRVIFSEPSQIKGYKMAKSKLPKYARKWIEKNDP